MALSGSALGGLIESCLTGDGATGPKRHSSCLAVGGGIVNAIVGTMFTLQGNGSNPGGGTGVGITNFSVGTAVAAALAAMDSQGPKANNYMSCVMNAVSSHLTSSAALASSGSSGAITVGSFTVTAAAISSAIKTLLIADSANGPELQNFCDAIGDGVKAGLATATGTVSGTSGSGTGTIS